MTGCHPSYGFSPEIWIFELLLLSIPFVVSIESVAVFVFVWVNTCSWIVMNPKQSKVTLPRKSTEILDFFFPFPLSYFLSSSICIICMSLVWL